MKATLSPSLFLCAITMVMSAVTAADAASASFSTNPPVLGSVIISNLVGAYLAGHGPNDASDSNVNDPKYVAYDQPAQGQTFTTGPNASGYKLLAVTLKHVSYPTFVLVPPINYMIRITHPLSTNSLSVIASETAEVVDDYSFLNCDNCNFDTIGGGSAKGDGSGRYITFTLDTPVPLAPNTTYGFDVGGGRVPAHYWETDGRDSTPGGGGGTPLDPYAGGNAYSSGLFNGIGDNTITNRAGDRVFVVAMVPGNVVVPPRITVQPQSAVYYAGRTARFTARAAGDTNLVYQWRKDATNLSNSAKFSGVLTDTLSISNVSAGELGAYSLFVTNSGGSTNSAPATLLALVAPPPPDNSYGYAILTNNPLAYWRLNETVDPSTNPPTYDYIGGGIGSYGIATAKANGPQPGAFPGFESTNSAVQCTTLTDQSWVTVTPLRLNTNTVTFTAWIYPVGAQPEFATLFWSRAGSTAAGIAYGDHYASPSSVGQLTYTWNQGAIRSVATGLVIPSDQWSFVALVVSPSSGTLYLGSGGALSNAVNAVPHQNELWNGPALIGNNPLYSPQYVFNGVIDEVAVFKRSLSLDQINTLYNIGRGIVQPVPPSFTTEPPPSQALYAGRTAQFRAPASGSAPLVYHWRKDGANLNDGAYISGSQTDSLTVSNVGPSDIGAYSLVVTNSVGAITSAPPATLTIVTPTGKDYEAAIRSSKPVAYWRLNETGDPSTNTPAFDFWGGFVGSYGSSSLDGFNSVAGPQPPAFAGFEQNNTAFEAPVSTADSWVTVPPLNLNTNTVTITLWLQPSADPVNDYAGLFFSRDASASGNGVGLRYSTNNQLGYVWNLGSTETSQFYSGLQPPVGQWSFAALVIEPAKATLYLYNTNALASATNAIPHVAEAWDGHALIGYDGGFYNQNFPGIIDEVAVFNYAFTPSQILSLYNAAIGAAPSVTLTIQHTGSSVVLSWPQGTLLEATNITGPWITNTAAAPPQYTVSPALGVKFYRVQVR